MKVLNLSYHPLNVRSGGWVDLSRKGNHGTPYGGVRPFQVCPGVMGYNFNGSGYVDCGSDESLNILANQDFTLAVWIKFSQSLSSAIVMGKYCDKATAGDWFGIFSNKISNRLSIGDGGEAFTSTSSTYNDGFWHYSVYVADRSGYGKIYVDAVLKASVDISSMNGNLGLLRKVGGRFIDTYAFDGLIALPVIEKGRAWSEAEVRENMYRSPIYRMLRGLPHSWIYTKVPWKQTQGGIYVP